MSSSNEGLLKILIKQNVQLARIQRAQAFYASSELASRLVTAPLTMELSNISDHMDSVRGVVNDAVAEIERLEEVSRGYETVPMLG